MKKEEGNPNFIMVTHGNMTINVPNKVFKGTSSVIDEHEAAQFGKTLMRRFPWLSSNAVAVILQEAKKARSEEIERTKSETEKARELISAGRFPEALRKMERLLRENPDEADAWYLRGEALCRMGRAEEGHRSIARARELSSPKPVRRRSSSRGH